MGIPNSGTNGVIVVTNNYKGLSEVVSAALVKQLTEKPASSIGLPVGKSILGSYEILAKQSETNKIDWSKARLFALDDYLQIDERHSFQHFLQENLYKFTNANPKLCFNPRFADNYDGLIAESGGLDLCILGIGKNGHIAFNEPGTPLASWTHCVWLSESTIKANKDYFTDGTKGGSTAVSMGISTILQAKNIILVATGEGKKEILKQALTGPPSEAIPASFLTMHNSLLTITDFHYQG